MSNILTTFLREACPHVGAHFWVRLPVTCLYFCVHTFCVNISTGHAARPAHGNPTCLRLHIFVGCRGLSGISENGDRIQRHSQDIRSNSQIEEFSGVGVRVPTKLHGPEIVLLFWSCISILLCSHILSQYFDGMRHVQQMGPYMLAFTHFSL